MSDLEDIKRTIERRRIKANALGIHYIEHINNDGELTYLINNGLERLQPVNGVKAYNRRSIRLLDNNKELILNDVEKCSKEAIILGSDRKNYLENVYIGINDTKATMNLLSNLSNLVKNGTGNRKSGYITIIFDRINVHFNRKLNPKEYGFLIVESHYLNPSTVNTDLIEKSRDFLYKVVDYMKYRDVKKKILNTYLGSIEIKGNVSEILYSVRKEIDKYINNLKVIEGTLDGELFSMFNKNDIYGILLDIKEELRVAEERGAQASEMYSKSIGIFNRELEMERIRNVSKRFR